MPQPIKPGVSQTADRHSTRDGGSAGAEPCICQHRLANCGFSAHRSSVCHVVLKSSSIPFDTTNNGRPSKGRLPGRIFGLHPMAGRAAGGKRSRLPCRWATDGGCQIRDTTSGPALGFRRLRCLEARRFPLASGLNAGPFQVKAPHQGPAAPTSLFVFLETTKSIRSRGITSSACSRRPLQLPARKMARLHCSLRTETLQVRAAVVKGDAEETRRNATSGSCGAVFRLGPSRPQASQAMRNRPPSHPSQPTTV